MNDTNNIVTIAELDYIYETYQRYVNFDNQTENVKRRHRAEENAIMSAMKDKLKSFEEKRRSKSNVAKPTIDKALCTPIPKLPIIPSSENHSKTLLIAPASGLAILVGLVLGLIGYNFEMLLPGFVSALFALLKLIGCALGVGGLFMWFFQGGVIAVESYLKWQKEISEYDKQMKAWECAYNKLDFVQSSNKLLADVAIYEKEFLSMVKDCDATFAELYAEMLEEKSKLSKQHAAELDERKKEWNEICDALKSVTLIHSDLFYIAWRISSALERGRANTLQEAINIAIDDERLAKEEAARQSEARRQEAILQRQAAQAAAAARRAEKAAEEQARNAEYAARAQAREAEEAARSRCLACVNYHKCSYTVQKNSLSCSAFTPK